MDAVDGGRHEATGITGTFTCGIQALQAKGLFALIFGMLLAVITMAIYNKVNEKDQKEGFPLVPFLWMGATLAYMI